MQKCCHLNCEDRELNTKNTILFNSKEESKLSEAFCRSALENNYKIAENHMCNKGTLCLLYTFIEK